MNECIEKLNYIISMLENKDTNINGIEKNIDNLGRITIPKSIRKQLNIEDGAIAKVYQKDNKIILEILK